MNITSGQTAGASTIETDFAPKGAVATIRGAVGGYFVTTQELEGSEQVIVHRAGTSGPAYRDVSYIIWG